MIISSGKSNQEAGVQMERKQGFPYWTAGFLLTGITEIECEKNTMVFPARSAVIIAPETPYRLRIRKKQQEVWIIFSADMRLQSALNSARGSAPVLATTFQSPVLWSQVRAGLDDLLRWWGSQPPELMLAENAMERGLLLAVRNHNEVKQGISDDRIERVTAHIARRIHEELPIDELARVAGLSPSRFAHLFHDVIGLTPMKFLEMQRIEKAMQLLLTTNLPVQQIGFSVGFPNAQHFAVRFSRLIGQPPSAFRQKPKRRFAELNPQDEE